MTFYKCQDPIDPNVVVAEGNSELLDVFGSQEGSPVCISVDHGYQDVFLDGRKVSMSPLSSEGMCIDDVVVFLERSGV
jgi:hypothetical protein